jgi:PAS domain S-box-containing protein
MKDLKISTIFFVINLLSIAFLIIIGLSTWAVYQTQAQLTKRYQNRFLSTRLADELRQSSDDLTRFARTYVVDGNPAFEKYYWEILDIRNGKKPRPELYERIYWDLVAGNQGRKPRPDGEAIPLQTMMKQAGFTEAEFGKLKEAQNNSDALVYTETVAMNAVKGILLDSTTKQFKSGGKPDLELARRIMHDEKYHQDKAKIMQPIDDFLKMVDERTLTEVNQSQKWYDLTIRILAILIIITIVLNFTSFFVLRQKIIHPVKILQNFSKIISTGNYSQDIPIKSKNEIGQLASALNTTAQGLRQKAEFAQAVGEKKFDAEFQLLSPQDQLGLALLTMRDKLVQTSEDEQKQNWLSEGLAKYNELTREIKETKAFCNKVLAYIIQYVEANQGNIFLLKNASSEEPYLELVAAYAFDRQKYFQKKFEIGEGLIGQTFKTKKTALFNDLPEDFAKIRSGLGESTPKNLLIVPIITNEEVEGLIELASLQQFSRHTISLVEKIAENMAFSIKSIQTTEHTQQLLLESQQKGERLQAQEEIVRKSLKKLDANKAEINLQNSLLKSQLLAIDIGIFARIEFDSETTIIETNEAFCKAMGYEKNEIIGKKHQMLVFEEYAQSADYQDFWHRLRKGEAIFGEQIRKNKNGEKVWLIASYVPVKNNEGKVFKIFKIAFNITDYKSLLEQTKAQAEALQANEEELRQNLEELSATQEVMAKKNKELEFFAVKMQKEEQSLNKMLDKMATNEKVFKEQIKQIQAEKEANIAQFQAIIQQKENKIKVLQQALNS